MIRVALTVLLLALGCGVAQADVVSDFTGKLDEQGVQYRDRQGAVTAALAVCDLLRSGTEPVNVVLAVQHANPGMGLDSAARFAWVSTLFYCPQFA